MTDSYHFESVPKFRVGGVYRNYGGEVVFLTKQDSDGFAEARHINSAATRSPCSRNLVSDGRSSICVRVGCEASYRYNLIPGELIQRDGQWVAADARIVFPSGAAVLTSGDKIVGRVDTKTPTLDKLENTKEPLRAPLPHFNQRTKHDPFGDGFTVTKGAVEVTPTPSPTTDSAYPAIAGLLRG